MQRNNVSTENARDRQTTVDQFTRQAIPFARMPAHADKLERLVEIARTGPNDRALDVACGPGLVSEAFAKRAAHVTGIDLTEAMIEQARRRSIPRASFVVGDAERLPFADAAFDIVVSRYSVHHFHSPELVFREMFRVCRPAGRLVIADMAIDERHADAFNELERLRDPSHQRALTQKEMVRLLDVTGFSLQAIEGYEVAIDLDEQLASSFPNSGDGERFRSRVIDSIGTDRYGINARHDGERIRYEYPIAIYLGTRRQ